MKENNKYLLGLSPICIGGFLGIIGVIILVAFLENEVSKRDNSETIKENTVSTNNENPNYNTKSVNNNSNKNENNDIQAVSPVSFKEFANDFLKYGTEGVDNFESYSESKINYIEDANAINTKTTPEFVFSKIRNDFKNMIPYMGKDFISFSYDGKKISSYVTNECNTCFFRNDEKGNWKVYKVKKGIECPE